MTPDSPFQFSNYSVRDLEIVDTTLREGSQTSLLHDHYKYFFSQTDKVEIARALIIFGVKFIELFAPVVSAQEAEDVAAIKADKIKPTELEAVRQRTEAEAKTRPAAHPHILATSSETGFGMAELRAAVLDAAES